MALLNYISFWVVRLPKDACVSCQSCDSSCPMNVRPSERAIKEIPVNRTPDCIVCHDCKRACPVVNKRMENSA
jgi:formate hydrogenlyase subunit 6/NADH:ubiquinone oxidoreductase subunit I